MNSERRAASYFVRVSDQRFRPTEHTGGAWRSDEQHFSPLGGLIVHAIDRFVDQRGPDGLAIARVSFDILGLLEVREFDVGVEVLRAGRTVELIEAVVTSGDRAVVRARAWRLARLDTSQVAGGGHDPLPPPDSLGSWRLADVWSGGYIASLDVRPIGRPSAGHTVAWVSTDVLLLADEPVSPLARFVGLADTANGIAVRQPPIEWFYPNVDLTIHLHRHPDGPWLGLETSVIFGPDGFGITSSILHDLRGPVGVAQQALTIRPWGTTGRS
ncbi:MAG TPA: thioesterase family protein [Candidatus Limnocylindrales bacterium]